ncbi:hypothetical protein [Neptunitalea lumnitzerae]|nr:hypothetical protein [Neptunitalea sp. Y10]
MRNIKIISFTLLFLILFIGCNKNERNVNNVAPKDSKLDVEILSRAKQILFNDDDLILVVNISNEWDVMNNHLLFYNHSKLYGAEYLPAQRVESIKMNNIVIIKNDDLMAKSNRFISDIPKKYSYRFLTKEVTKGSHRISNKIIKKMFLDSKNNVVIDVLYSDDLYLGLRGFKALLDSDNLEKFNKKRQITYPISDLLIDYENNSIIIESISDKNILDRDQMIIESDDVMKDFYNQLIQK